MSKRKAWIALFGIWTLFVSGVLSSFVGSPGIIQAVSLKSLLEQKLDRLTDLEKEIGILQAEQTRLESSRAAQEREVRLRLGYAAPDELIFDFTPVQRLGRNDSAF